MDAIFLEEVEVCVSAPAGPGANEPGAKEHMSAVDNTRRRES